MEEVIGVDEVGRGCWAGPLVAAAVRLNIPIDGLRDSKVLSAKRRSELAQLINRSASVGIGWVSAQEIDQHGLTWSVQNAMLRAIEQISLGGCAIIVDGNINYLQAVPRSVAVIKADGTVPAVSAASIVAKVARDTFMQQMAHMFPEYGFEHHVGYGTARHKVGLQRSGLTPLHRRSFRPVQEFMQ